MAASHGDTARVKELLAQGADPNDKERDLLSHTKRLFGTIGKIRSQGDLES